jgi:hypothetical protein
MEDTCSECGNIMPTPCTSNVCYACVDGETASEPCGCAEWRPTDADQDWHLSTCGIAPAPSTLRLV